MNKRKIWNFQNIPPELTQLQQWVNWKYFFDKKRDKWTKPPCKPNGKNMDPHKPGDWLPFPQAVEAFQKNKHLAGLGLALTSDLGLVGIDLDHCLKNGTAEPWAAEIVHKVGSYAEISPSGEGIRIFVLGRLPGGIDGRRKVKVEMYTSGRYLTVTGNALPSEKGAATLIHDMEQFLRKPEDIKKHPQEIGEVLELADDFSSAFVTMLQENIEIEEEDSPTYFVSEEVSFGDKLHVAMELKPATIKDSTNKLDGYEIKCTWNPQKPEFLNAQDMEKYNNAIETLMCRAANAGQPRGLCNMTHV